MHGKKTAAICVRPALPGDAEAICAIYNEGIADRIATLETRLRTPPEQRQWLLERSPRHPVVVAEDGGRVIGWGSLNSFNPRAAYDYVADFSVYVARTNRGQGVGALLLSELQARAHRLGYHKLVLAMFPVEHRRRRPLPPLRLPRGRLLPRAGQARRPLGRCADHGKAARAVLAAKELAVQGECDHKIDRPHGGEGQLASAQTMEQQEQGHPAVDVHEQLAESPHGHPPVCCGRGAPARAWGIMNQRSRSG